MSELLDKRLVIVTGKGGVGKSTVSLALALAGARQGKRTILCEVASQEHLSRVFHRAEVGFHEVEMAENLWAISIDPDESMREYVLLQLKVKAMRDLLFRSRVFTYLAAATPGLKELVTIGKIWELALDDRKVKRGRNYDLVIVDAPATGHGVGFLQTPRTFANVARVGPIRQQAETLDEFLRDRKDRGRDRRPARGDAGQRDREARARPGGGGRRPRRPDLPATVSTRSGSSPRRPSSSGGWPVNGDGAVRAAGRAAVSESAPRPCPARAARPAGGADRGAGDDAAVPVRARARSRGDRHARRGDAHLMAGVAELLEGKRVCICAGSGGVGKTTTSAAIAAGMAARGTQGRGADDRPGEATRRLARAARARQHRAPGRPGAVRAAGVDPGDGELWAMMLDAKQTFDEVVRKHAPDEETRERILSNRIYQQLSSALAGSQEYMAMEKLFEIHAEDRYDLLVLDTPPTRNALDFLDAPKRLTQFIEGRALQVFMRPAGFGMKVFGRGTAMMFSVLRRITGVDLLEELAEFFQAFSGMVEGFRERARRVNELLADAADLVPRRLRPPGRADLGGGVLPSQAGRGAAAVRRRDREQGPLRGRPRDRPTPTAVETELADALGDPDLARRAAANFADYDALAARDRANVEHLAAELRTKAVIQVPYLDEDVHDLAGLMEVNRYLFASGSEERTRIAASA